MKKIVFAVGLVLPLLFTQGFAQEVLHTEDPVSTSATVSIFARNSGAVRHHESTGARRTKVHHRRHVIKHSTKKHHRSSRSHRISMQQTHKKAHIKHHVKPHHVTVKHPQTAKLSHMAHHKLHRKPQHKAELERMKVKPLTAKEGPRKVKVHPSQRAHHDKQIPVLKSSQRSRINGQRHVAAKIKLS